MRSLFCVSCFLFGLMAMGCESKTKFEPKTFTAEEQAKINAEDKAVIDEESHGTADKGKGKVKKK